MRPIVAAQSSHRFPLNKLFGAESHVRILRVLTELGEPLSTIEIAQRTGLTPPGARRALASLVLTGLVERLGTGLRHQYALNAAGPLASEILKLFDSERRRTTDLLDGLRQAVHQLSPPPLLAWTPGFPAEYCDPWEVSVVHTDRDLTHSIRDLRRHVASVAEEFGVTVEITGFAQSDQPNFDVEQIMLLIGEPFPHQTRQASPTPNERSAQILERRSLAYSRALAKLIERDPSLVKRARLHVVQSLKEHQGSANQDLEEWHDILQNYSLQRLSQFLTSSSERTERLLSTSPFAAVLSSNEHEHLLTAVRLER
ncbi:helix-turn-helix domain-containing protein [Gemmatimonadota bacterium]